METPMKKERINYHVANRQHLRDLVFISFMQLHNDKKKIIRVKLKLDRFSVAEAI